jgi:RNA polymerase sigma-70 factor (ECF subfamily)
MEGRALPFTDDEYVRRFQETGDNECFAELFVRHRKKVFFACRGFFGDPQRAEDATQETFLRAYRRIRSFEGGDFAAWLVRIARNVCIDEWRRNRVEAISDDPLLTERAGSAELEPSFELHERAETVLREMRSLCPEQRRCLELKIEGCSYQETSARTGFSIDAVKSHLQNGRRMLWKRMEHALAESK